MESTTELILALATGSVYILFLIVAIGIYRSFLLKKLESAYTDLQQNTFEDQILLLQDSMRHRDDERARISRDLHDKVSSRLNLIHLSLQHLLKKQPESRSYIDEMIAVLADTINTSNRITRDLLPPCLESFGLGVAVEEWIEELEKEFQCRILFERAGERLIPADKFAEMNLFRSIQELLHFMVRGDREPELYLRLMLHDDRIKLVLKAKGEAKYLSGFESSLEKKYVESRLQLLDGLLISKNEQDLGLDIQIEVKLEAGRQLTSQQYDTSSFS